MDLSAKAVGTAFPTQRLHEDGRTNRGRVGSILSQKTIDAKQEPAISASGKFPLYVSINTPYPILMITPPIWPAVFMAPLIAPDAVQIREDRQ